MATSISEILYALQNGVRAINELNISINTLSDSLLAQNAVEYGTWLPTFNVFIPGDIAITYFNQTGKFIRLGNLALIVCDLSGSFTATTASGQITVGGLPWATDAEYIFPLSFSGITKVGFTEFWGASAATLSVVALEAGASGSGISTVTLADFPGASFLIRFSGHLQIT